MCLYNGSYSDYTRWIALQTFAVPGEVQCIDDNSRHSAQKLATCHAEALRRSEQEVISRAVRISFSRSRFLQSVMQ